MLPQDTLSTQPVPAPFSGAQRLAVSRLIDYEDGGIGIEDTSQGLLYQVWRARLVDDQVLLSAPNTPEYVLFVGVGLTEISITFDQLMRPALAFVEQGVAKLWWYDSAAQAQVVTEIGADVITPRVTLDDKRAMQSGVSDIILAYLRDGALYYRQQRDRFTVEIDPTADMPEAEREATRAEIARRPGLIKIGMNRQNRLQFMLEV